MDLYLFFLQYLISFKEFKKYLSFDIIFQGATINCRRLCFNTFNNGWQLNWQKFYTECLGDPQETVMAECLEEGNLILAN